VARESKKQQEGMREGNLTLLRRRPAALAGVLVDVDVAVLAVVPLGDPGALDLLGLLLLLLVVVLAGEGVEELFDETGHFGVCCWFEGSFWFLGDK
jgi:hypothetical protein